MLAVDRRPLGQALQSIVDWRRPLSPNQINLGRLPLLLKQRFERVYRLRITNQPLLEFQLDD
jgi:hypothetical protein